MDFVRFIDGWTTKENNNLGWKPAGLHNGENKIADSFKGVLPHPLI